MDEMPKAYESKLYEDALYQKWLDAGVFAPEAHPALPGSPTDTREPYSIMMPPPNVTGVLHLGHALENALMDAMARYQRLQGKRVLLLPGTDHAALPTQAKVEKKLMEAGMKNPRQELGREALVEKIRLFAEDSRATILAQVKKLGTSADWSRLAYTFDEKRNLAVNTLFKKMYDDGLIYRGERMVNWDPKGQTTISDDEIVYKEEITKFYYFQYGPFVIGTARPETKFGDKHVVMHPDDARYADYQDGQTLNLEWINGPITATIVKDTAIDMTFGTGVMTITPSHSVVDFEIAERHGLDKEQVIDLHGKLLPIAGEFAGQSIFDAREKIVDKLQAKGLVVKVDEKYVHNVGTAERSGATIEPQMMLQWWLDVSKVIPARGKSLRDLMREAVTTGLDGDASQKVSITPDRFVKLYLDRVDNLRDWCLSRQIWWGHRIPVWYKGDETIVGDNPTGDGWTQDEDTLDTWFSSGSWTFSTLGWPEQTLDLKTFHPTSWIQMGYEILYLWLMRMILMSTYALEQIPFKNAYIHGILRDKDGKKFSKSSGNGIDPIEVINSHGCDALRISVLSGNTPGNDSRYYEEKVESARNLVNKLWNISRFVFSVTSGARHVEAPHSPSLIAHSLSLSDRWILGRFSATVATVTKLIDSYDFSLAIEVLRDFTWNDFADWYLEIAKIEKNKDDILLFILERLLILWHPFAPFVTEEIFSRFDHGLIVIAKWPVDAFQLLEKDLKEFNQIRDIVTTIRDIRAEQKIAPKQMLDVLLTDEEILRHKEIICGLSRVSNLRHVGIIDHALAVISRVVNGIQVLVVTDGSIDPEKQRERNAKDLADCTKFIAAQEAKLANADFVARAPEKVITLERQKLTDLKERYTALMREQEKLN